MKKIEVYNFKVDSTKTFEEMVSAGNYDWKNVDVESGNFPLPEDFKTTELVGKFFDFGVDNRDPVKNVEEKIKVDGFRPATSTELLAFGATHPEVQKTFPIIALGTRHTAYYENATCLCLYPCSTKRVPGQRGLGVHYYAFGGREKNLHALGVKEVGVNSDLHQSPKKFPFLNLVIGLFRKKSK
ncbi:MAG: hypothetical protein WCK37_03380 [Candidatus Falkowbacteria bacterium]